MRILETVGVSEINEVLKVLDILDTVGVLVSVMTSLTVEVL